MASILASVVFPVPGEPTKVTVTGQFVITKLEQRLNHLLVCWNELTRIRHKRPLLELGTSIVFWLAIPVMNTLTE